MREVIVKRKIKKDGQWVYIHEEGYLIQFSFDVEGTYAIIELEDGSIISTSICNIKYKYPTSTKI